MYWTEIAQRLPEHMDPGYVAKAYAFGRTGDPYGHRKTRQGSTEADA